MIENNEFVFCLFKKVGIKAAGYHAGLADKKREEVQKNWITDKIKVVCATIAFGKAHLMRI